MYRKRRGRNVNAGARTSSRRAWNRTGCLLICLHRSRSPRSRPRMDRTRRALAVLEIVRYSHLRLVPLPACRPEWLTRIMMRASPMHWSTSRRLDPPNSRPLHMIPTIRMRSCTRRRCLMPVAILPNRRVMPPSIVDPPRRLTDLRPHRPGRPHSSDHSVPRQRKWTVSARGSIV